MAPFGSVGEKEDDDPSCRTTCETSATGDSRFAHTHTLKSGAKGGVA